MIAPRILSTKTFQLAGLKRTISLSRNQTRQLWQEFMPQLKELNSLVSQEYYSAEVYPSGYFDRFNPNREFEKWAAVASGDKILPETWEKLEIPAGLYAVFHYKGKSGDVHQMYQYILGTWLPNSGYILDNRPHFAVMGENYRNNHPESEEDLWIPVRSASD